MKKELINPRHKFLLQTEHRGRWTNHHYIQGDKFLRGNDIDGSTIELHCPTTSDGILYSGPHGIEDWIRDQRDKSNCAWELFQDFSGLWDDFATEPVEEVDEWYFDNEDIGVYLTTTKGNCYTYEEWYKLYINNPNFRL